MADSSRASRPVILVDGRSGAGKTSFARFLASRMDAELVSLDDVYPGWDGLAAGSAAVLGILAADGAGWRGWDWAASRPAGWHPVGGSRPLVVEGCGALTRASRALADVGIWIELDAGERRRRALERDGDAYAPHWDRWAAQEDRIIAAEHPRDLADLVLTG